MTIVGAILFIAGAIVVATIYAVGFAVLGFGLATLAVFYYLGAFWGVAWLVLNILCLIPFFVRFVRNLLK